MQKAVVSATLDKLERLVVAILIISNSLHKFVIVLFFNKSIQYDFKQSRYGAIKIQWKKLT